jgi:hypothetical protein
MLKDSALLLLFFFAAFFHVVTLCMFFICVLFLCCFLSWFLTFSCLCVCLLALYCIYIIINYFISAEYNLYYIQYTNQEYNFSQVHLQWQIDRWWSAYISKWILEVCEEWQWRSGWPKSEKSTAWQVNFIQTFTIRWYFPWWVQTVLQLNYPIRIHYNKF